MAAVHNKELLLRWYVTTLGLREIAKSRLPRKSTCGGEIVPHHEPTPPKSEWVISIEEKLTQGRQDNVPGSWAKLSIYRIPQWRGQGLGPQIVSLGPYHHHDKHLRHMERHKWRCLHRILERSGQEIGLYLDSVKKVERKARACYEGRISMSCDKFVEMMVLDGCFVIEMFLGLNEGFENLGYPPNDPVFSMRGSILQIRQDMIMLENQIPLFILHRLLSLQVGYTNQKERVAKLAIQFLYTLTPKYRTWPELDSKRLVFDPLFDPAKVHCLEVFRRSCLHLGPKRPKTTSRSQRRPQLTRCLTDLREAGIKIRVVPGRLFGDIEFNDGILQIPGHPIDEGTRSLFLNWIAFEQSHFDCSYYVTSYVIFMHDLIKSPEDVRYLCNRHIISHCLESNAQVVDLFNRLCQEVAFNIEDSYLLQLHNDLEKYYYFKFTSFNAGDLPFDTCCAKTRYFSLLLRSLTRDILTREWNVFLTRKWSNWVAILKNKYFDSPWSIISLIAASVLLVLTFMQTFYTAHAYYKLPS
ncbi:hypothetical protein BT93_I0583 [Corymbia citriodora subsp. variegata]|nr:hypothetical protein BT93_I0583 [Corymbia citriodora subsp. variegata]